MAQVFRVLGFCVWCFGLMNDDGLGFRMCAWDKALACCRARIQEQHC